MRWHRVFIFIGMIVLQTMPTNAQPTKPLCELTKAEAHASPQCLRWYLACDLKYPKGPGTGLAASLSLEQRWALMVQANVALAERNCEHFDYAQAYAAMRAKTFSPFPKSK
jgi:hypothetical protein